jgi:hypothetical protein
MLNRVVGLGVETPATEAGVDDALAAIGPGVTFYVAMAPGARPVELPEWLRARGLEPGWGWMVFRRDVEDPPRAETPLQIAEVGTADEAAAFGRIVRVSYELPQAVEPRFAGAPDAGWLCWLALDGDEPAGAAALYAAEGVAYLGLAGTSPSTAARERRAFCSLSASTVPLNSVATLWSRRRASDAATDRATPTATSCGLALRSTRSPRTGSGDRRRIGCNPTATPGGFEMGQRGASESLSVFRAVSGSMAG